MFSDSMMDIPGEFNNTKLNAAVSAAVKSRRSSILQGNNVKSMKEVEAVLIADRVMKRSHSDYIYVPTKPPADVWDERDGS
jgi:hypothetical protein